MTKKNERKLSNSFHLNGQLNGHTLGFQPYSKVNYMSEDLTLENSKSDSCVRKRLFSDG